MEDLFDQLFKESCSNKYINIKKGCLQAKDILESQSNLIQCSPSDLRETCLKPLQDALETKQSRMVSLALTGFYKLLRDNQFYSDYEDLDETKWLPCQVMNAIQSLPAHSEDVQVELLKIILSMSCIPDVSMSGHVVVQIFGICGMAYGRGTPAMRSVSQSAAVQTVIALLNQIKNESDEQEKEIERRRSLKEGGAEEEQEDIYDFMAPAFDELVPVINYIAEKLTEANKHRESKKDVEIPALFLLECTNSLIEGFAKEREHSAGSPCSRKHFLDKSQWQPPAYCSTLLVSALWQRLCPALIALLGTPVSMRVSRGTGRTQGQMGRGSGTASLPSLLFNSQEAKVIYSIACNLIVAMGTVGEMRPVFESLFYRMLLYPPPSCRQDALKTVAEVLKDPQKLVQLAGPILHSDPRNHYQSDLSLLRIMLDSFIECSNLKDVGMQVMLMNCIAGLLASLEELVEGQSLSLLHTSAIHNAFASLEEVDYMGPVTYEHHDAKEAKYDDLCESFSSDVDSELPETFSQHSQESKREDEEEGDKPQNQQGALGEAVDDPEDDSSSVSSGQTEGPTEEEKLANEKQQLLVEEENSRLLRLSENLGSNVEEIRSLKDEEQERERLNAEHFCVTLQALLPSLLAIRSTIEVDEAVLEFSSKYCQGVFSDTAEGGRCPIIINADGIYLATYSALSLNLKLITSGFYCQNDQANLPISKDQFVEKIFGSGVLVYLSCSWVGEVFDRVVLDSFLQRAGYNPHSSNNCALINLLTDLDGMGVIDKGSQMLSDFRRLERAAMNVSNSASRDAGHKLCRRILTCGWESIISILGTLLKQLEGEGGILTPIRLLLLGENARKDEAKRGQDTLILCLNSLQSTARLANTLGLQKRCGVVFSLLSSACLPKDERNPLSTPRRSRFQSPSITKKPLKLHTAHVLSFHVMMSAGLELGSHASDCWSHLFRCCLYLAELERKFFSGSENVSFGGFPAAHASGTKREPRGSTSSEELFSDDFSSAHLSPAPEMPSLSLEELLAECPDDISNPGFLSTQVSGKALCCLTLLVDKFFDNASSQLNLEALVSFLKELCRASQAQLFSRTSPCTPKKRFLIWSKLKGQSGCSGHLNENAVVEEALLLHRLGEVMLKLVRSGRPLIHIMRVWAVAGPHFLEAACHKDGAVSKKAVCSIHDIVNAILGSQTELPHFHFNEALFKPFENLLCLELCDIEVQDQIVSSICEFVESCNSEIRSGWRPLFGALRCVRAMPVGLPSEYPSKAPGHETVGHLRVVKDVFEAFLSTDNVLVFANAALDCILCLLKHVKGLGEGELITETVVCWGELVGGDLCLDALRYIHRCAVILASMYMMPACPVFHAVHRINVTSSQHLVDCNIQNIDEAQCWALIGNILNCEDEKIDYSCLWPKVGVDGELCLQEMDEGSGLLQVWYVLLEGLSGAVITCPRRHQPQVLDTLFILMRSLQDCPGPTFGLYCINHLLLPLMQDWLRRSNEAPNADWECAQSFKQYTGLTSDLVVDYLRRTTNPEKPGVEGAKLLMLQQCLIVLVECVSSPSEVIARLGCSCIRHVALSCGENLTTQMWDTLVCSLHRASQVSLFPLYQLMKMFCPDSPNFYGDIGQVKVAARRDCTGRDTDRLRQLSHQVFLLDSQRTELTSVEENPDSEDRSFVFLLYPVSCEEAAGEDITPLRVPFRALVVGLLANQMIIQTLGQVLVEGSPHVVPSLANVLLQASDFSHFTSEGVQEIGGVLPGMLPWMKSSHIFTLLNSLTLSYEASIQFDRRPGLKFLIQKVAQSDRAANLYKQAGASWTLRMLTLFDLILSRVKHGLDLDQVKRVIDTETARAKTIHCDDPNEGARPPPHPRPTSLMEGNTEQYIHLLCRTFSELCEAYLELVSTLVDKSSASDLIDDQPIFFLTIPADDFSTDHRKSLEKWSKTLEHFNKDFIKTKSMVTDESQFENEECSESVDRSASSLPSKMTLGASIPHCEEDPTDPTSQERKPFSFADLAQALNSDDDQADEDDSNSCFSKEGDSGVASAGGMEQSVYSIATEKDISVMVGDYRRRKNKHSLPSQVPHKRLNPFVETPQQLSFRPSESVPPEIEEQRSSSLMKDSEAHLKVWTEMVVTVFDLVSQLKDSELRPLLPLVFPTVRSLTAHAHDPHLRQVVAELLNRVACLYGFSPAE